MPYDAIAIVTVESSRLPLATEDDLCGADLLWVRVKSGNHQLVKQPLLTSSGEGKEWTVVCDYSNNPLSKKRGN